MSTATLSQTEREAFDRDGYLLCRQILDAQTVNALRAAAEKSLHPPLGPLELEADVGYPGAPVAADAPGGATPRRLLHAYSRDAVFRALPHAAAIANRLRGLMDSETVCLSQNHHNCVMTKFPGFSSRTAWHQDVRYWCFDLPELVSVWVPLVAEHAGNGVLQFLPGSHRWSLDRGRLDAQLFLREDLADNQALISKAVGHALDPGDVLFFHCRTLHAASANTAEQIKLSLVYTFHEQSNTPIPGTRSARYSSILLSLSE